MCVGTVITLSFQRRATSTPFSLDALRFYNSVFALRFDWNLPLTLLLPLGLFIAFSLVPPALWSGALTPNVIIRNVTEHVPIPNIGHVDTSDNPLFGMGGDWTGSGGCPWLSSNNVDLNQERNISFHNCLHASRFAFINSASTASALNPLPGGGTGKGFVHTKQDRSGYSILGRSYGVGGGVGVVNVPELQARLSYGFVEPGLHTKVHCTLNRTAAFQVQVQGSGSTSGLFIYQSDGNGTLPEGLSVNYGSLIGATYVGYSPADIFAWASAYNNASVSYFALAAVADGCEEPTTASCLYRFGKLHRTQCQLQFVAQDFQVKVNNVNRTLTVTPQENITWPSYADALLSQLASEHNYMSLNDGQFGGSGLGHGILNNVNIVRAYANESSFSSESMLRGTEAFIADIMDNTLMLFAQSRLFTSKSQISVPAVAAQEVVVYGTRRFIYATVGLNALIVTICIAQAIYTRFWNQLSKLDPFDTASIAVGASCGGKRLASHAPINNTTRSLFTRSTIMGSKLGGNVKVKLREVDEAICAIELADVVK
jgi:hypothetical protein